MLLVNEEPEYTVIIILTATIIIINAILYPFLRTPNVTNAVFVYTRSSMMIIVYANYVIMY